MADPVGTHAINGLVTCTLCDWSGHTQPGASAARLLTLHRMDAHPEETRLRDRIEAAMREPICLTADTWRAAYGGADVRLRWEETAQLASAVMEVVAPEIAARDGQIADLEQADAGTAAALARVRQLHRRHDCATDHIKASTPMPCVNDGVCLGCGCTKGYECRTIQAIEGSTDA